MTQEERRIFLIKELIGESGGYAALEIPADAREQKDLLRTLMNLRGPRPAPEAFLLVQDDYLKAELADKGITEAEGLAPAEEGVCLWRGDITTLRADAIVNAANGQMLGCFVPCHGCIDNAIHTYAGVQLRWECAGIMEKRGKAAQTGEAILTGAYNLPARHIIHIVGPIVTGQLKERHRRELAGCYRSCLALAEKNGIKSLAFCCISTGEFHFPREKAAEIAVHTVREYQKSHESGIRVIFNVFGEADERAYRVLLSV